MDNNDVDNLGRWNAGARFPSEMIEMGPTDGNPHSWSNGIPQQGYLDYQSATIPAHEARSDDVVNHESQNGSLSGFQTFNRIDPVEPGNDPTLPLNSRDVCSFIINKMIGTGIFLTPPAVLLLTGSKGEALGLWILGFAYTLVATLIYLEFSRKLPHTGGELIYLDEALPAPRLFAYTLYTFYFIFMYNTATNSMNFANQVLISANVHNLSYIPDGRLLRFIAIIGLSFFCLLHYFSARAGRALNQFLAFFKVTLLAIVFFAGIARASKYHKDDWKMSPNHNRSSSATAFLLVVWSFTGWENSTFVSGEIANHRILKRGFIGAVVIVGTLYILVNLVFLFAIPYTDLIGDNPVTAYVPVFFGGGVKARLAWAVLTAISACGNLQSVIYTCARVKQVIGMSNIIPWSRIWRSSSPVPALRTNSEGRSEQPTPKGGLMLHWVFSVILISATSGMYNISEAITFPGNLQAYASGWVGVFISIGFPFLFLRRPFHFLRPRTIPQPTQRNWNHDQEFWIVRSIIGKVFITILYFAFNTYIIIVPLIPPYVNGNGTKQEVKGWIYITVIATVMVAATTYYYSVFGLTTNPEGELEYGRRKRTLLNLARAYPVLHQDSIHEPTYGVRRWVEVVIPSNRPSYLYWFFGGSDEDHHPDSTLVDWWNRLMGR